jgi:hypothetical protein
MPDRVNPCLRNNGTPKTGFATKGDAERWIEKNVEGHEIMGIKAYPCNLHGWHIGGRPRQAPHRRGRKGKW